MSWSANWRSTRERRLLFSPAWYGAEEYSSFREIS
jgi:hypothetical protein